MHGTTIEMHYGIKVAISAILLSVMAVGLGIGAALVMGAGH